MVFIDNSKHTHNLKETVYNSSVMVIGIPSPKKSPSPLTHCVTHRAST